MLQKFRQVLYLPLENQNVHGQKGSDSPNAGVAYHFGNIVKTEILGASPSVPVGYSEIHCVGAVVDGGGEHFTGPDGE